MQNLSLYQWSEMYVIWCIKWSEAKFEIGISYNFWHPTDKCFTYFLNKITGLDIISHLSFQWVCRQSDLGDVISLAGDWLHVDCQLHCKGTVNQVLSENRLTCVNFCHKWYNCVLISDKVFWVLVLQTLSLLVAIWSLLLFCLCWRQIAQHSVCMGT